ncbi:MAG: hypothetical protein JOZ29_07500 [Deltaproteobacteria bacterium]|nr:hypothetical protein [Deltaproteobacteria bacterium]
MKYSPSVLAVIILSGGLVSLGMAQVAPAPSQESASGGILGSVTNGNNTIVFEAANTSDIEIKPLKIWGSFAAAHPSIARALAFKPSLMNDPAYLRKHPELKAFFQEHPEVRDAMAANPGNFDAIPPRPGE